MDSAIDIILVGLSGRLKTALYEYEMDACVAWGSACKTVFWTPESPLVDIGVVATMSPWPVVSHPRFWEQNHMTEY